MTLSPSQTSKLESRQPRATGSGVEPPVPAKGSDSSPNAYRKTIGRGSTSIVHISSEPYNVLISAKNLVVCTQLYRIIQGFHNRMPQSRPKQRLEGYISTPIISPKDFISAKNLQNL